MAALAPQLSERDRAILRDLYRVRLLTGRQLERLHFAGLATANARSSARRRTMQRLVKRRLVTTLDRRVGGVRAGSSGLVYRLDVAAIRQAACWAEKPLAQSARVRRPWPVGWPFVQHTLDVAELYVRLRERERHTAHRLREYLTEPASWYASRSGTVKPDAYAVYDDGPWEVHRWLEIDRETESLPTVRRKLDGYLTLAEAGDSGPTGVLPSVLITVPTQHRLAQVNDLIATMPAPATDLITVQLFDGVFTQTGRAPP